MQGYGIGNMLLDQLTEDIRKRGFTNDKYNINRKRQKHDDINRFVPVAVYDRIFTIVIKSRPEKKLESKRCQTKIGCASVSETDNFVDQQVYRKENDYDYQKIFFMPVPVDIFEYHE